MRSLGDSHRLSAQSVREVTAPWKRACGDFEDVFQNGSYKLKPGPALNALVLHFLSLDQAGQERVLRSGLSKLREILSSDRRAPGKAAPKAKAAPRPPTVGHDPDPAKKPRKGRAG